LDVDMFMRIKFNKKQSPRCELGQSGDRSLQGNNNTARRLIPGLLSWQALQGEQTCCGWLLAGQAPPGRAWTQSWLSTSLHCKNRSCVLDCKYRPREEMSALPQECDKSEQTFVREKYLNSQERAFS